MKKAAPKSELLVGGKPGRAQQAGQPVHQAKVLLTSPIGLHARPAAMLVRQAHAFESEIEISCKGRKANAKSILGILVLCARRGAELTLTARGPDASKAVQALTRFIASGFEGLGGMKQEGGGEAGFEALGEETDARGSRRTPVDAPPFDRPPDAPQSSPFNWAEKPRFAPDSPPSPLPPLSKQKPPTKKKEPK